MCHFDDLRHQSGGALVDQLLHPLHRLTVVKVQAQLLLDLRRAMHWWMLCSTKQFTCPGV